MKKEIIESDNNNTDTEVKDISPMSRDLFLDMVKGVLESKEKLKYSYGYGNYRGGVYGYGDSLFNDEDYYDSRDEEDYTSWWMNHLKDIDDEEWEEYERNVREYEEDYKRTYGMKSSTKFINGMEVDDEEFDSYNRKSKSHSGTRRGGSKHKKRKARGTRYYDDDWWDDHDKDGYSSSSALDDNNKFYNSLYVGEEKKIVFYRNLPDEKDVLEWSNLLEFNEWCQENSIAITDSAASILVYSKESHCCLDPETTDKMLVVDKSYGGLVWEVTGGDEDMLKDASLQWNHHGI